MNNKTKMTKCSTQTIMIIDDTPENLGLLETMLQAAEYEVVAFPRGDLALQAASRNPPVVILLDIMMPGMDGYEVCRRLKEDKLLREIPIIFITALDDTASKLKAYTLGGVDFINKPFQESEVLARIQPYIEVRQRQIRIKEQVTQLHAYESERNAMIKLLAHDMEAAVKEICGNVKRLSANVVFAQDMSLQTPLNNIRTTSNVLTRILMSLQDITRDEGNDIPYENG